MDPRGIERPQLSTTKTRFFPSFFSPFPLQQHGTCAVFHLPRLPKHGICDVFDTFQQPFFLSFSTFTTTLSTMFFDFPPQKTRFFPEFCTFPSSTTFPAQKKNPWSFQLFQLNNAVFAVVFIALSFQSTVFAMF